MSRLTLCAATAAALAAASVALMAVRHEVMGDEVAAPSGPGTYRVTVLVRGRSAGDARLTTACPLDFQRQHVFGEAFESAELTPRPQEAPHPDRRLVQWSQKARGPR